jgi:hypothetical protein
MARNGLRRLLSKAARALITGLMVATVVAVVIAVVGFALILLFFGFGGELPGGTNISDCHGVDSHYPGAVEYEDTAVPGEPIPVTCGDCHTTEAASFNRSLHALPAYATTSYDWNREVWAEWGRHFRAADS